MTMSRNKPSLVFWTDAGRAVLLVLILLQLSWTTAANAAGWSTAPSMMTLRAYHTSTLLPNGKVLVVGGINGSGVLDSPEVFDPATGLWSSAGSMSILRQGHTATLLPNGKVLVMRGKTVLASICRAFNSMTRQPMPGRQPSAARLQRGGTTPPPCYPAARCWSWAAML